MNYIEYNKKIRTPVRNPDLLCAAICCDGCLITQQLVSQPQQLEQPQQPSLSYDELSS
jgi:hypothetical protein